MHPSAASGLEDRDAPAALAVLIVDDQLAVREGLARLLSCAPIALRGIGTAASGAEALKMAAALTPDVIVLDVDLAGEDGLALIPQFPPGAGVLVLTCHGDPATRERAERFGASAFVEKHRPAGELLASITAVASGRGVGRGEEAPGPWGEISPPAAVASSAARGAGNA